MSKETIEVLTGEPLEVHLQSEQTLDVVDSGAEQHFIESEQVLEIYLDSPISPYPTGGSGNGYMSDQSPDTTQYSGFGIKRGFTHVQLSWIEINVPKHHKHTRVLRSKQNDPSTAVNVGDTESTVFADNIAPDATYYYWLQGVTYTGNTTDYSEVITVSVSADQQKILEYLGLNNVLSELNRIEGLIYSSGGAIGLQLEELAAQNLSEALKLINDSIITVNENMFSIEQRLGLASDEAFAVLTQQLTALVDDNNARITQINTLTAQIENETGLRQAEVSRLDQAFANQDSAIATTRTELEALIETEASKLAANILSEKEAAVTREEALARSIDSLSTTVTDGLNQVNADIEQERISRSNSESALASQITDLESSFQTTEAELNARINQELTTLTTANSALAQEVTDLRTSIDTEFAIISADVSEQLRAFSDENGSFAESLLNLEANYTGLNDAVSNVNAALNQESITRANENEALAQQSNALRTEFETYKSETDARIETIETTQSGPDGSLAQRVETLEADYTSLEGDISTNSARITSEETARANADQSLSNRITTLRSDMETDIGTAVAEAEQYTLSVVGYCTIDGSISDDTTKASCEANGGVWSQLPLSQALDKVSVTVTKPDGTVTTGSVGTQFTAFADDLGNIKTRAFLGTDVNGRVTGLVVTDEQGNESSNKIQLVGSQVEILNDETGVPFVSYDTVNKRGVIRGQLILDDGTSVSSEDDIRARDGDTIYVEYEYSETGISAWHSPMAENDVYRRERTVTNGVPGEWSSAVRIAGFDAPPKYNWIKYSPNADGSNLTDIPDEDTKYIGISYNNDSPTESTNPADYMWTKFVGDTPVKGEDYFDGKDGNFISFIYKVTDGNAPAIPTGGSFDGTNEVFPTGWSDDPIYEKDKITWVSKRTYSQGSNGSWSGSPWSTPTKWYEKGEKGDTPTITTNPDGSYTISNGVDSVTVKDGDNAPIPTVTNNNNGTYTIEDGSGNSITVKDGDTPIKGVDYFDGVNGDYVSFIYRSNPVKPATPTGGSFDGTTESLPGIWSDTPTDYTAPEKRWVSSKRYRHNGTKWVAVGNWSEPVVHAEKGDKGDTPTFTTNPDGSYTISNGTDSITVKDGDNAPIPTVTDNGNGTYTINDGSGNTITVSDGYTPQKGIDYFDGLNGDFVSYVYRTSNSKPAKPSGGSFNGTNEVVPSSWSDAPTSYTSPNKRWVSTRRYRHNGSSWNAVSGWSDPVVHAERGQAATQYYTWVKYAKLFYSWTGSRSWKMETTIANAVVWTFDAPVAGKVRIGIKASDAEGGSRMAVDGTLIGTMSGPDNATRWYYFETTVTAGSHDIQIWSSAADGGSVLAIEVIGSMSDSGVGASHIGFAYQKTSLTESTSFLDYQWSESKGKPGPGFYTITNSSGSFPSNDQATIDFVNNFIKAPEVNDHLTYVNAAKTSSTTKRFNGSSWIEPTLVVNGDALVKGTVTTDALAAKAVSAAKIDVDDLFAQDITATGTISGLNLTGARVEARDTSTGKYALLDSGTGSPIVVNDGTRDVLRFDSDNKLILDAGLGAGTINDPSVFSQAIWDQIKMPVTEGATGGSFSGPDVVGQASYGNNRHLNELISEIVVSPTNTAPINVGFRFYDMYSKYIDGNKQTNTQWRVTITAQVRSSSADPWGSITILRTSHHTGVEANMLYITDINISESYAIEGLTPNGQCLIKVKVDNQDMFYGLHSNAGEPKLSNVTAIQQVQGGGAAGAASTLNGLESSDFARFSTDHLSNSLDEAAWVVHNHSPSNIDHVWHDEANNIWNFVSDASWKSNGNAKIRANRFIGTADNATNASNADTVDGYHADKFLKNDDTSGGNFSTTGSLISGRGSGGVALTINDGKGNANVTFNHAYGVPEQSGNAARIEVNTDGTTNSGFSFEVGSGVTGGQSVDLQQVLWLSASDFQYKGNSVYHTGNKPSKADVGLSIVQNRRLNWSWGTALPTHIWGSQGSSTEQYVYTPNDIRDAMDIRWSDIQSKPKVVTYGGASHPQLNDANYATGIYDISSTFAPDIGLASDWYHVINMAHQNSNGYGAQIAVRFQGTNPEMRFRSAEGENFGNWATVYHTANKQDHIPNLGTYDSMPTGRNVLNTGVHTYGTRNTTTNTPHSSKYGESIVWGEGDKGAIELWGGWVSGGWGKLYTRALRDTTDSWSDWYEVYTSREPRMRAILGKNTYTGLAAPDGNDGNWIRTTGNGLLPFQSGVSSSLGTSSWKFSNLHVKNGYIDDATVTGAVNAGSGNFGSLKAKNDNTNTLTIDKSSSGVYSGIQYTTGGKASWLWYTSNNGTEDFALQTRNFNSDGSYKDTVFSIDHSNAQMKFKRTGRFEESLRVDDWLYSDRIRNITGTGMYIYGGDMAGQHSAIQAKYGEGELIYLAAEGGVQILSSGDNLNNNGQAADALTNDRRVVLCDSGGNSRFYQGTVTTNQLHTGNGQITSSTAALQVNGFQRTGTIYLHEGGSPSSGTEVLLSSQSGGSRFRVTTKHGYMEFGPYNVDWGHIITDRPKLWASKPLHANGGFFVYNKTSQLTGDGNHLLVGPNGDYYSRFTNNGRINRRNAGWANNSVERTLFENAWASHVGDHILLHAMGNVANNGALIMGREAFAIGRHSHGTLSPSSVREVFSDDTWMSVTSDTLSLQNKRAFRYSDGWLRINENKDFSAGVYFGNSLVRMDYRLEVGSGGNIFSAQSGNVSVSPQLNVAQSVRFTGINHGIWFDPDGYNDAGGIRFRGSNGNDGYMEFWTNDDYSEPFVFRMYDSGTSGANRTPLRIDSNKLTVNGEILLTSDSGLVIRSSTNNVGAKITFSDNASTNYQQRGFLTYKHGNGAFGTASDDAFELKGSEQNTVFYVRGDIRSDGKLYENGYRVLSFATLQPNMLPPPELEGSITASWLGAGVVTANIIAAGGLNVVAHPDDTHMIGTPDAPVTDFEASNSRTFSIHPLMDKPIHFYQGQLNTSNHKDLFYIDKEGGGFFRGGLAEDTVDADAIQEEAKKAINPYFISDGEKWKTGDISQNIAHGSNKTSGTFTTLAKGDRVSLKFRFSDRKYVTSETSQNWGTSVYRVYIQRSVNNGSWTNLEYKDVTVRGSSRANYQEYDFEYDGNGAQGVGRIIDYTNSYSYSADISTTDTVPSTSSNIRYRVYVTRTTTGTGTSGGLVLKYGAAVKSSFVKNSYAVSETGNTWESSYKIVAQHTDKDTGFTTITGRAKRVGDGTIVIDFPVTLTEAYSCVLGYHREFETGHRYPPRYRSLNTRQVTIVVVDGNESAVNEVSFTVHGYIEQL